jgi:hypothetical protein
VSLAKILGSIGPQKDRALVGFINAILISKARTTVERPKKVWRGDGAKKGLGGAVDGSAMAGGSAMVGCVMRIGPTMLTKVG